MSRLCLFSRNCWFTVMGSHGVAFAARWLGGRFCTGDEDQLAIAASPGGIVHTGWAMEEALHSYAANRVSDLDYLFALHLKPRS